MKLKQDKIANIVNKYNKNKDYKITNEDFIMNAERYIKAIKECRMLCNIESVSQSGMSRVLRFLEMNGNKKEEFRVYNFGLLFDVLGYTRAKNSDGFRIYGCGMDMVFHTNYTNIHNLHDLGFINKSQCDKLAQKTPHVI